MICNNLVKNGKVGARYSDLLRGWISPRLPLPVAVPLVCSFLAAIGPPDSLWVVGSGTMLLSAACFFGLLPLLALVPGDRVDALQQVLGDIPPLEQVVLVLEEDAQVLHHLFRLALRCVPLNVPILLWRHWQLALLHSPQEKLHLTQQLQKIKVLS
jgi:hypothetical protein